MKSHLRWLEVLEMTDVSKLEELASKKKTIEVNGIKIDVKPKKKDLANLMTVKKELTTEDAEKTIDTIINIIKRANPDLNDELIENFVLQNFLPLLTEILRLFGFETPELSEIKKQIGQ